MSFKRRPYVSLGRTAGVRKRAAAPTAKAAGNQTPAQPYWKRPGLAAAITVGATTRSDMLVSRPHTPAIRPRDTKRLLGKIKRLKSELSTNVILLRCHRGRV